MTTATREWVEARCPECSKTQKVEQGFTEGGDFFRDQAFCPPNIKHKHKGMFIPMKPYGVSPGPLGTVQVKARKSRLIA